MQSNTISEKKYPWLLLVVFSSNVFVVFLIFRSTYMHDIYYYRTCVHDIYITCVHDIYRSCNVLRWCEFSCFVIFFFPVWKKDLSIAMISSRGIVSVFRFWNSYIWYKMTNTGICGIDLALPLSQRHNCVHKRINKKYTVNIL